MNDSFNVTAQQSGWSIDDHDDFERAVSTSMKSDHEEAIELLYSLPRNLHFDKVSVHQNDFTSPNSSKPLELETLAEEDDGDGDEGLTIAWQYRKSVQKERLAAAVGGASSSIQTTNKASKSKQQTKELCHSYDLQCNLMDQLPVLEKAMLHFFYCPTNDKNCATTLGIRWFQNIRTKIDAVLKERNQLIRLLFYRNKELSILAIALPMLVSYIRQNQLPVVLMVSNQSWTFENNIHASVHLNNLRRLADAVIETEGFVSRREYPQPSEFRMFQGLLKIRKITTMTGATANGGGGHFADRTNLRQPAVELYGLKRDRRKLHIQMLHIPPEDYVEGGGSVGGGAVRSGAGRQSSEGSNNNSNIDSNNNNHLINSAKRASGLACASSGGALDF